MPFPKRRSAQRSSGAIPGALLHRGQRTMNEWLNCFADRTPVTRDIALLRYAQSSAPMFKTIFLRLIRSIGSNTSPRTSAWSWFSSSTQIVRGPYNKYICSLPCSTRGGGSSSRSNAHGCRSLARHMRTSHSCLNSSSSSELHSPSLTLTTRLACGNAFRSAVFICNSDCTPPSPHDRAAARAPTS